MIVKNNERKKTEKKKLKISRKFIFIATIILSIIISITSIILIVTEFAIPKEISLYKRYDYIHQRTDENYTQYLHFDVTYSNPTYLKTTDSYYVTATILINPQNEKYTFKDCSVTLYINNVNWGWQNSIELQLSEEGKAIGTITNTIEYYNPLLPPIINSNTSDLFVEKISGYVYV